MRSGFVGQAFAFTMAVLGLIGSARGQQALLQIYGGTSGTLTQSPSGSLGGIGQPVTLTWRQRGVGIDGTWRRPWEQAQLAANPSDLAALGEPKFFGVSLPTGAFAPSEVDLSLPCIGPSWTIGRTRRNLAATAGSVHGAGWSQTSQPQLVFWDRTGNAEDVVFLCYGGDRFAEYRRVMNGNSATSTFRGVNGAAGAFTNNIGLVGGFSQQTETPTLVVNVWTYHDPTGITVDFFGSNAAIVDESSVNHVARWQVWRITDAEGHRAYAGHPTDPNQAIVSGYDASGRVTLAYDSAGRQYDYVYNSTLNRLTSVTASYGGGTVGMVTYGYYASTGDGGTVGDLCIVTTTIPSSGGDVLYRSYYRYWNSASSSQMGYSTGPVGAVRMAVGPEGVRRAAGGDGAIPSLTDTQWAAYGASRFCYDSSGRVEKFQTDGLTDRTFTLRYETPTTIPSTTNGYDQTWASRTVALEYQNVSGTDVLSRATTSYFDEVGQVLSSVVTQNDPGVSTTGFWATYVERDANGAVTLVGTPKTVSGYVHSGTATPFTATAAGLRRRYDRVTSGALVGFIQRSWHATTSSDTTGISDLSIGYRSITSNGRPCKVLSNYTVYRPLIETLTRYPSATGEALTYSYTLPDSSGVPASSSAALAIDWMKMTHPSVDWTHHGPGSATVSAVALTRAGRVTHVRARGADGTTSSGDSGSLTFRSFDSATGLLTTQVDDADFSSGPGAPSGFPAPSSNAASRITNYTYDAQGRPVQVEEVGYRTKAIGYSRLADGRPTFATADVVSGGYASPGSFVVRNQRGMIESDGTVIFGSTPAFGQLATGTTPPSAWIDSASSDALRPLSFGSVGSPSVTLYSNDGRRAVEHRAYFQMPASGSGSTAQYDLTTFGYDGSGLPVRRTDPTGTITALGYDVLDRPTGVWRGLTEGTFQCLANYEYDGGYTGGNSQLTRVLVNSDGIQDIPGNSQTTADNRTTDLLYDDMGRVRAISNPVSPHLAFQLDNLGRATAAGFFSGSASSFLSMAASPSFDPTADNSARLGFRTQSYDALGQVYHEEDVMGPNGGAGTGIPTDMYYDAQGRVTLKMGETSIQYSYADSGGCGCSASTVTLVAKANAPTQYSETVTLQAGDVALQETHTVWDSQRRDVIAYATVERHSVGSLLAEGATTQTGPLTQSGFISGDAINYAMATYGRVQSQYFTRDELHRVVKAIDWGNADFEPLRSALTITLNASSGLDPDAGLPAGARRFRGTFTSYDESGFTRRVGNELGDAVYTSRDLMGRPTLETSTAGTGQLPVTNTENACKAPEHKSIEWDKGRLLGWCASSTPGSCPELPNKQVRFGYPDNPGAGAGPYTNGEDTLWDNNVPKTIYYSGSNTPDGQLTLDRMDFAHNAAGEESRMTDGGGVESVIARDLGGRETQRNFNYPSGNDALGFSFVDSQIAKTTFSYDGWGRETGATQWASNGQGGYTALDESVFSRDVWGNLISTGQKFWLPDGAGGGSNPFASDSAFEQTLRTGYSWNMVDGRTSGESGYWRGHRQDGMRLPGTADFENLDERFYYSGIYGFPAVGGGGVNGNVDVDATIGRVSQTTLRMFNTEQPWEQGDYFGIYHPAETARPQSNTDRVLYLAVGMIFREDPEVRRTGVGPWGEQETDYWRYCAGSSPCSNPGDIDPGSQPLHRVDARTHLWDCGCGIFIDNTVEPRDKKKIEIECASRTISETSGKSVGNGTNFAPADVHRADYWNYDSRGNPTFHKRLVERNGPSSSDEPTKVGEFDEARSINFADQATQNVRRDGAGSSTVTTNLSPFYDARGNLRDDGTRFFLYDAQNRLTEMRTDDGYTPGGILSAKFTYDAMGRRTSARYDSNTNGSLADDEADMYVYDAQWRVTGVVRVTPVLNGNGQPTGSFTKYLRERYVYSPMFQAGDGAGGDTPIGRQIDWDGNGTFEIEQHFITDRQGAVVGVLERRDSDNDGIPDSTPRLIARVSYTMYGEPEIYRPTDVDRSGWTLYDPITQQPNIDDYEEWNALYTAYMANTSGSEVWREYLDHNRDGVVDSSDQLAFNDDLILDASADMTMSIREYLGALPLYAAYWWDPQLKLYHVRHRVYDPYHGTWMQRDPIGFAGGANLYGYVGNAPWSATDPTGLTAREKIVSQIGTLLQDYGCSECTNETVDDALSIAVSVMPMAAYLLNSDADLDGHDVLSLLGMHPVYGIVFDGINTAWYAAEGDWENAADSLIAMIPIVGDVYVAGQIAEVVLEDSLEQDDDGEPSFVDRIVQAVLDSEPPLCNAGTAIRKIIKAERRAVDKAERAAAKKAAGKAAKKAAKEAKGGVYVLRDKDTHEVKYVGRTDNHVRREGEHNACPEKQKYYYEAVEHTDDYEAQRALEQHHYEQNGGSKKLDGGPLDNKIRPVSKKKWKSKYQKILDDILKKRRRPRGRY